MGAVVSAGCVVTGAVVAVVSVAVVVVVVVVVAVVVVVTLLPGPAIVVLTGSEAVLPSTMDLNAGLAMNSLSKMRGFCEALQLLWSVIPQKMTAEILSAYFS